MPSEAPSRAADKHTVISSLSWTIRVFGVVMPIRFKCRHCKKALRVPDTLAGRKNICPACRKPIIIPKPKPSAAEVEDLAASMLSNGDDKKVEKPKPKEAAPIKFMCEFCAEDVQVPATAAGTKMPCPECKRIIRVPVPNEDKPKDWRDVSKKKGPMGAKDNQPEELENAWGTEQTRRVTNQALLEADAIPTNEAATSLAVWLKRGFWTTVIVGFGYMAMSGMLRSRSDNREKAAIEEAVKLIPKLRGDWAAEIHRGAGELYCAKRKPIQAQKQFRAALACLTQSQKYGLEIDMFLIDLALSQVELGGSDDDILSKEKFAWAEVQGDVSKTLEQISSSEARAMALRLVGTRLADKKQLQLAIGLAGSSPMQQTGLTLAYSAFLEKTRTDPDKEISEKAKREQALLEKQPDKKLTPPRADEPIDYSTRIAHVEGLTRVGKFDEALNLAGSRRVKGPSAEESLQCLDACIAAAELALASKKPSEANRFLEKALEAIKELQQQRAAIPKWSTFELVRAAALTNSASGSAHSVNVAEVQELAKLLDASFQPYIQLVFFRQKLAATTSAVTSTDELAVIVKERRELLSWPLAWEALAEHNALHGVSRDDVVDMVRFADDDRVRAFLLVGFALGQHQRNK